MKSTTLLILAFAAIVTTACDRLDTYSNEPYGSVDARLPPKTVSNYEAAYRTNLAVFAPTANMTARGKNEPEAAFALRQLDRQLTAFRQRGLEYWKQNPGDPRVLDWLAATVALPPSYAKDPVDWADQAFGLQPNRSERDEELMSAWRSDYTLLKEQFFASPDASEQLKRFLWSSEMRQALFRERDRFAATGVRPDPDIGYVDRLLDFIAEYPTADEESAALGSRSESYLWSVISVARPALSRRDILFDSNAPIQEFAEALLDIESDSAAILASDLANNNFTFTFHPLHRRHKAFEQRVLDEKGSFENWYETQSPPSPSVDGIFYSSPLFPAMNQPQNEIEAVSLYFDNYVGSLMVLEKGRRYWEYLDTDEKAEWLSIVGINRGPAFFPKDPLAYTIGLVDTPDNLDVGELDYWVSVLGDMTDELLADEKLPISERRLLSDEHQLLEIFFARRLQDAARLVADVDDSHYGYAEELIGRVESIVLRTTKAPNQNHLVAHLLSAVSRYSEDMGITETRLQAMLGSLPKTGSAEIQNTIDSALNPVELTYGTRVRIQAPTLDGQPFDTDSLLGKIVLIDHWNTSCGPCIAAMPGLHSVYERYRDKGVEVVSIAYDGEHKRSRVERLKSEMALTWTTLNGEGLWPGVSAKYGYRGVPQYMLLNRDGRWVAGNEEMGGGENFEALLNELLAAEATEKEGPTVH